MTDQYTNEPESNEQDASGDGEIRSLGENRYVVSPDGGEAPHRNEGNVEVPVPGSESDSAGISELDGAYALELDARFEGVEEDLSVETSDVSVAFDALLRWYAGNVAEGMPPEDVIATLLANSELDVVARPATSGGRPASQ